MKKILCILLTVLLIISFASCNREEPPAETPESSSTLIPEDTAPELGIKADLSDKEITIVHWDESTFNEFYVAEEDLGENIVSSAVYERNRKIEELLGVTMSFEHNTSASSSTVQWFNTWCDRLQNMMDYPPNEVDLFACYSKGLATATIRGLNKDMSTLQSIDLSKDWWPKSLKEQVSVGGGRIYYVTGEISPNAVANMYTVFYNKDTANIDAPASLVENKAWTVDKMIELASGIYSDVDGVDGKSAGDIFGLAMSWWSAESIVKGAGFRLAEDGGAETPIKLSDDLYSSELSDFINKLSELCKNDSIFNDPTYNGDASEAFFDGRAAFWINVVGNAAYLNESDVDYGILPMPLLNYDQDGYVTPLANNYSNYAIARSCDDDESAAAVLSALAYYGQTLVTPAVYELYFENSSADNGDTATIFWLMTETMRSDVDATFAREIRTVGDELSIAVRDGRSLEDEFGTLDRNAVERDLGILNEKLKGLNS